MSNIASKPKQRNNKGVFTPLYSGKLPAEVSCQITEYEQAIFKGNNSFLSWDDVDIICEGRVCAAE